MNRLQGRPRRGGRFKLVLNSSVGSSFLSLSPVVLDVVGVVVFNFFTRQINSVPHPPTPMEITPTKLEPQKKLESIRGPNLVKEREKTHEEDF
jgi:hypothetical protein